MMKQPILYRVYLDITNKCPNSCLHCYADSMFSCEKELSLEELTDLVQQMAREGIYNLVISGGEPFTRTDLFDFLWICKDNRIDTVVITSGVLLYRAKVETLRDTKTHLRISLDGVSESTHDYVRGIGAFKGFIETVKLVKQAKFDDVSVHFTLNRMNLKELLLLPSFLNEIGIREVTLSTIKPTGRTRQHPELLIEPALVPFARERIKLISQNKHIIFTHYKEKNWSNFSCPAAYAKCGITSYGRITPCIFLGPEFHGGSLRDKSFRELLEKDEQMMRLRNLSAGASCFACSKLADLHGGCRARALYYENNNLGAIDPYCCEIKKQFEKLVKIS